MGGSPGMTIMLTLQHQAAHHLPWLKSATAPNLEAPDYFPYFRAQTNLTVSKLFQDWSITAAMSELEANIWIPDNM